jgi:hypothetical protein
MIFGLLLTQPTDVLLVEDNPGYERLFAKPLCGVKIQSFALEHPRPSSAAEYDNA